MRVPVSLPTHLKSVPMHTAYMCTCIPALLPACACLHVFILESVRMHVHGRVRARCGGHVYERVCALGTGGVTCVNMCLYMRVVGTAMSV